MQGGDAMFPGQVPERGLRRQSLADEGGVDAESRPLRDEIVEAPLVLVELDPDHGIRPGGRRFFRRKDLQDREVDPIESLRVGHRSDDPPADIRGRIVELLPPRLIRLVAELKSHRRGKESAAPLREFLHHGIERWEDLAVVDEEEAVAHGGRHLADLPVLEKQAIVLPVRSGRLKPGGGLGIGDGLALGLVDRPIRFDVDAHADDTSVMPITVEHQVDELVHGSVSGLDL